MHFFHASGMGIWDRSASWRQKLHGRRVVAGDDADVPVKLTK
jgi:hypothetical protein